MLANPFLAASGSSKKGDGEKKYCRWCRSEVEGYKVEQVVVSGVDEEEMQSRSETDLKRSREIQKIQRRMDSDTKIKHIKNNQTPNQSSLPFSLDTAPLL